MNDENMFENEHWEPANTPANPPERDREAPPSPRANITVNSETALRDAITGAPSGTPYEIAIGSNFTIGTGGTITIPTGKQIILSGATLTRAAGYAGYLFTTQNASIFTLTNVTIDGNGANVAATNAMIYVANGANLNIEAGAVLRNNRNETTVIANSGGAIQSLGNINMTGGAISGNTSYYTGCTSCQGGGIYLTGTGIFAMSGGEIADNYSYTGGGISTNSTAPVAFLMTGGVIHDNEAANFGGGVAIYGSEGLMRNEATIENNTAFRGGGVETNGAIFTMEGGYIVGNHAIGTNAYSGGVDNGGTFNMIGGSISGNTSDTYGGAMYNVGTLNMSAGATMSDNYAANNGGAIMNRGPINADHAIFSGNISGRDGGVAYMLDNSGDVNITDSLIVGNVGGRYAGAIRVAGGHLTLSGADMLVADNSALSDNACDTGGAIRTDNYAYTDIGPGVIFTGNYAVHAFNMPLESDQAVYDAHVHSPSLDPQYDYAYNNADINWCAHSDPTVQITYWRNEYPGDSTNMTLGTNLAEGDEIFYGEPMWQDGEYFAGWSLRPDDTCPTLTDPAPTVYHSSDFSADDPANLNVYAIWCEEPIYHEVTFDPNGGSAVPAQSILDGQEAVFGISNKAGCVLEGWYTHPSLDVRFNFHTPIYENLHLYAKWICEGQGGGGGAGHLTPAEVAELARLESLLAAMEAGEKCYNIGILTEYGYQLIERGGQLYLRNQLLQQDYLAIVPLTIAEVEDEIEKLEAKE
jgi:hypothetical protein